LRHDKSWYPLDCIRSRFAAESCPLCPRRREANLADGLQNSRGRRTAFATDFTLEVLRKPDLYWRSKSPAARDAQSQYDCAIALPVPETAHHRTTRRWTGRFHVTRRPAKYTLMLHRRWRSISPERLQVMLDDKGPWRRGPKRRQARNGRQLQVGTGANATAPR